MTLRVTPDLLAATYEYLRVTQPIKAWKLPPADEVAFHVIRKHDHGDFEMDGSTPVIRISETRHGHLHTLLQTMAHEMVHLRQFLVGDSGNHNALFHKLARQVCKAHGYDPKSF